MSRRTSIQHRNKVRRAALRKALAKVQAAKADSPNYDYERGLLKAEAILRKQINVELANPPRNGSGKTNGDG